jgi:beta-glucosidase
MLRKFNKLFIVLPLLLSFIHPVLPAKTSWSQEIQWNWSEIDQMDDAEFWQSLSFDKDFMWGVATSAFQIEGTQTANGQHCSNSWTMHDNRLPQPGIACDHWNCYQDDVQLIKNLGMNAYRFSIEWSKIEPEEGIFDADAMQHYIDLVDELIKNNIKPIPCLFHHAWPAWFEQKGAFEKADNIGDFVTFAEYVFEKLNDKVSMWMTFNEPVGYALEGYFRGKYPPFKKSLKLCGIVVQNILNAHVAVYQQFKEINPYVQVGFPKIFQPLDNYHQWNPLEKLACTVFNHLLHDVALNFFATGHFNWAKMVTGYNPLAPQSLDFLGINYYTHTLLKHSLPFKLRPANRSEDKITGSGRIMYPEGLYRAIEKAATTLPNVALHIGENGVNDPEGVWQNEFIKKHLYVVQKAIEAGYNICGYFWWTLMDSFSWKSGEDSKMGLYEVNFDTQERTLRESAKPFVEFLHRDEVTFFI